MMLNYFFFVLTANSDPRDPEVKASYKLQLENVPEGKIHEVDKMSNESCYSLLKTDTAKLNLKM